MDFCILRPVNNDTSYPTRARHSIIAGGHFNFGALRLSFNPRCCKSRLFGELDISKCAKVVSRNLRKGTCGCARSGGFTVAPLPQGATKEDAQYVRMCVSIARKALGYTSPNPMVGCVIVKDGQIVGQGFHPKAGEPHAEVFALREAGTMAEGATAYVSLEPCNHYGRTPPCTQALIRSKVKRVVVGMVDPNPIVSSQGVATLRNSGIDVIVGVEEHICQSLNEEYIYRNLTGKPFVAMRLSMSLDGGMLDYLGDGAVEEGGYYSELLKEYDGVIVSDYVLFDNPTLLSYEAGAKQPLRIVVTRKFDFPIDSVIFNTNLSPTLVLADERAFVDDVQNAGKQSGQSMEMLLRQKGVDVIILKRLDFVSILDVCNKRGLCSVLLESKGLASFGSENFFGKQALEDEAFQKLIIAICPLISGIKKTGLNFNIPPSKLNRLTTRMSKDVALVEGYFLKDFCYTGH
ncbi:hypothetical protein SUGI_1056890 [Cryptomeria japonica]|uniref:riboflavin biosynthesis protein PYRD, chloroplastic n=1 Tax=Cryptomeria japonica TaxID=3369 RepID=UPI0024148693|nr:riboflavin biosynthesis protein PYRD, chloroplastic [Cryptomeria japonica]GLJ49769.1 hypothetical protein SUGI_1056890 [Cryptomeria japonica]